MIKAIAAIDKNGLMGNNFELPWKTRTDTNWDLQNFKKLTTGNIVFMGYNTYKSLQNPLQNRLNVVEVNRPLSETLKAGFQTTPSLENFLTTNKELLCTRDLFIIGGSKILKKYAGYIEELILTEFFFSEKGNIYFPSEILQNFNACKQIGKYSNGNIKIFFNRN
ncbi:MAG: dihydrofolate reductase [Treponema sp.]|nr:dihydrofolate reductase [Treponema sp.]